MGNLLETLPDSLGDLQELRELEVAGNRLHSLPDSIGNLGAHSSSASCSADRWHAAQFNELTASGLLSMCHVDGTRGAEKYPAQAACTS